MIRFVQSARRSLAENSGFLSRPVPTFPKFFPVLVYAMIFCAVPILGYRMQIPYGFYQLLSQDLLKRSFAQSLWNLHSQPPALNFVLGLALKLQLFTGLKAEVTLWTLHFLLGAWAVAALARFIREFIPHRLPARVCLTLIVLHPVLYCVGYHYFYTFHEFVIFSLLALWVRRFFQSGSPRDYALVCALFAVLVYTRSLFHFVWAIAMLGWILKVGATAAMGDGDCRRKLHQSFAITSLVLLLWPIKNLALFGVFSYSSWQGLNFSQGLSLPPIPHFDSAGLPAQFPSVPAVTRRSKSDGTINWNHYSFILESRWRQKESLRSLENDPMQIARKASRNYWSFTRSTALNPYKGDYAIQDELGPMAVLWVTLYNTVVLQDFRVPETLRLRSDGVPPPELWPAGISGFVFLFPLVLAATVFKIFRSWKSDPTEARTAAFLLACILWVLIAVLFIDGCEGNRMRFSTEPYWIILFFGNLPSEAKFRQFVGLPRKREPH